MKGYKTIAIRGFGFLSQFLYLRQYELRAEMFSIIFQIIMMLLERLA